MNTQQTELAGLDRARAIHVAGDPLRDSGKYITIYRRQPGDDWLMAHDIWNSDGPPPSRPTG
ncbi:MAG TPA: hypothetical protein VIH92_07585 [Solirubrobacteraceae bacterium]